MKVADNGSQECESSGVEEEAPLEKTSGALKHILVTGHWEK